MTINISLDEEFFHPCPNPSSFTIKNEHPHCLSTSSFIIFGSFLPHPHIINMILDIKYACVRCNICLISNNMLADDTLTSDKKCSCISPLLFFPHPEMFTISLFMWFPYSLKLIMQHWNQHTTSDYLIDLLYGLIRPVKWK